MKTVSSRVNEKEFETFPNMLINAVKQFPTFSKKQFLKELQSQKRKDAQTDIV